MSIQQALGREPRPGHEFATLAGGCFWCLDAVFAEVEGVNDVECGYAGGHVEDPGYRQVCQGDTGHAEVVRIEFDPVKIAYRELLEIFFGVHDPTTRNRQGNDVGSQYRSAIFWHGDAQKADAQQVMREVQQAFEDPVVTELVSAPRYYRAEQDHQEYFRHHPEQGYCQFVINPKLEKFRRRFASRRRRRED